jgi:DNA-binding HxlR family transcriptional regulator
MSLPRRSCRNRTTDARAVASPRFAPNGSNFEPVAHTGPRSWLALLRVARFYDQYCPVAKGSETLGDRWTMLIVREMLQGIGGFNELQRGLPGISRSVLAERLRRLERSEIIERETGPGGRTIRYRLTAAGRDLQPVIDALGEWGATWAFTEPRPEELDPDLLIVWIARHVDHGELPPKRIVVQFDLREPAKRYWIVLGPSEASVCAQHPGFDVDLTLRTDTKTLYQVYLGQTDFERAIRAGAVTVTGASDLRRAMSRWFTWSKFAAASRSAEERRRAAAALEPLAAGHPPLM